jgi:hypothetical protein
MKKATRQSHFRFVSVSQLQEKPGLSAQESHVLPVILHTLPYGTHLPYGQIAMLWIIFWFQVMYHRNFIREFLHYFSSLLVNCGHRCSSHRKCRAILKCGSRTFTISNRRWKSTATTSLYRAVCTKLLAPWFSNHFSWWNVVLINILLKFLKHVNCSWRLSSMLPRNTLCFCWIENIAYCHKSAREKMCFSCKNAWHAILCIKWEPFGAQ